MRRPRVIHRRRGACHAPPKDFEGGAAAEGNGSDRVIRLAVYTAAQRTSAGDSVLRVGWVTSGASRKMNTSPVAVWLEFYAHGRRKARL